VGVIEPSPSNIVNVWIEFAAEKQTLANNTMSSIINVFIGVPPEHEWLRAAVTVTYQLTARKWTRNSDADCSACQPTSEHVFLEGVHL
jgi:hypothetical protein